MPPFALCCPYLESLLGCQRSEEEEPPFAFAGSGLGDREELRPCGSSSRCVGRRSGWKAGNLNVPFAPASGAEDAVIALGGREAGLVELGVLLIHGEV